MLNDPCRCDRTEYDECEHGVPTDGPCDACSAARIEALMEKLDDAEAAIDVLADYAIHVSLGHVRLNPGVCRACAVEAAAGTEDVPHPIPARFHRCVEAAP